MWAWLEGLLLLFAFGTMGFWVLLALASCLLIGLLEFTKSGWATFTLFATLVILYWAGNFTFHWIGEHPYLFALYILGYLVTGAGWAIFKWWRFVVNLVEKYNDRKSKFLKERRIREVVIPDEFKAEWARHVRDFYDRYQPYTVQVLNDGIVPPDPNNHKEEIYLWITFWPWSMLWFVLDEPVRKTVRAIYRSIRNSLVRISEHAFQSTKADFSIESVEEHSGGFED